MKVCTKCGIEKELTEFSPDKKGKNDKASRCKICMSYITQQCRKNNPGYYKQYYKDNKDKIIKINNLWRGKNKDRMNEWHKQWCRDNSEKVAGYERRWQKKNRKKLSDYAKQWQREICKKSLKHKIARNMRTAIRDSLKGNKANRSWLSLVPYTLQDLIKHLKKTVPGGYIWNDYIKGKLHIDHKIPISAFNFSKPEHLDFQKCWALSNLQLLSATDNKIKHAKLTKPFQPSLAF